MFLVRVVENDPKVGVNNTCNVRSSSSSSDWFDPPRAAHRSWFLPLIPLFPLHLSSQSSHAARHPLFTEIPSCLKASWCSALLNQQHIKVKSAGKKKKRFPAKVQLPHHVLLSPLKRDRLHSRRQKGGSRDSKIVIINISVVWLDLDHVCMDRDWMRLSFVVVKEDSRSFRGTKSLNLWHFLSWIEPLQAEFNPELSLNELRPSNDYV